MIDRHAPVSGTGGAASRRRRPSFSARVARSKMAVIGLMLTLAMVGISLLAPWLSPSDPFRQRVGDVLAGPGGAHPLGTDQYGRDVLSRVLWGGRFSLQVGLLSVAIGVTTGALLGLFSGSTGGLTDHVLERVIDLVLSFPSMVIAILIVAMPGSGTRNIILALGITILPRVARVIRGQVLAVRVRDYIEAARGLGASHVRVMFRHILPNALSPLIVLTTLYLPTAILIESSLSFLGIGVSPDTPTWGRIISDGREYLQIAPWISVFPGIAITAASIGFNMLGDGLRDVLDPRLRV